MSIYSERLDLYGRLFVKEILQNVAENGLMEDQHFYICFNTKCRGLILPESYKDTHENNLLLLIRKDEYKELCLDKMDIGFQVEVHYAGQPSKFFITYASLVSFVDPTQDFSLEFTPIYEPRSFASLSDSPKPTLSNNNILLFPKNYKSNSIHS